MVESLLLMVDGGLLQAPLAAAILASPRPPPGPLIIPAAV